MLTERRYAVAVAGASETARPAGVANDADRVTRFTYDRNGRRLTETRESVVAWTVDPATGALVAATGDATVTYAYNGLGLVTSKTEATGDTVLYTYDRVGRLVGEQRPDMISNADDEAIPRVAYFYDGVDNLVRVVEGYDRVTTNRYDAMGRKTATVDAMGFERSFHYDRAGNLIGEAYSRRNAAGTLLREGVTYRYDAVGRLSVMDTGYVVTDANTLTSTGDFTRYGGSATYDYDALGRQTRQVDRNGAGSAVYDRQVAFDTGGRGLIASETVVTIQQGGNTVTTSTTNDYGVGADYALGAVWQSIVGSTVRSGGTTTTTSTTTTNSYDPADMLGDLSPVTPTPAAKRNKCGAFGKILLVVVAVAVTIVSSGTALALSGAVGSVAQGITTVMSLSGAATVGTSTLIAAGVAGAMVGSAASQGVAIATGMQDRFDWTGVAMAGVTAAVSGGLAAAGIGSGVAGAALRGALGNTITQGVAMATGLQKRFDWVGLAVAGVASGFGALAGKNIPVSLGRFVNQLGSGLAVGIAGGATRSVLTGTSFGDNVLAVLPDVIGSTVGSLIGSGIARISAGGTPFVERGGRASATLSTSHKKYPNSSDVDEIVVTGRRPSTLDFSVNLAMAIVGHPTLTSFGGGPEVGIPIEHTNPVPKNAEDARHQLAKTLAQIDNFPASAQSKLDARATVEAIYAPYLDPETYQQLESRASSISSEVFNVDDDIVSVGVAEIPISTFSNARNAPGAEYFSNVSSGLDLYVEFVPKTIVNEAATLAGVALADIAGSLATPNPAESTIRIPTIGGRAPVNSKYAGQVHPSGVRFTEQGFPNFRPYSQAEVEIPNLTGRYGIDSRLANEAMRYPNTPKGYVWHHVEDGATMQLIPKTVHNSVKHTGGAAVIRNGGFD